jgi:two-component system response regulator ResD
MRKVFITDDSQIYIDILSGIIAVDDVLVCSTTDALQAVDKIVSFMPDVIVIDKTMPDKDGLTLLREIKNDKRIDYIPRLLISGDDLREVVSTCSDFDDYIDKLEDAKDIRMRVKVYADIGQVKKAARGKL